MTNKQYKFWLKSMRFFGKLFNCHQLPERSFHIHGVQLPLCARCTGILIGYICALISFVFYKQIWWIDLLFLMPLIFDGTIQLLTKYESNNFKRLITGLLFGFGFLQIIILGIYSLIINLINL